MQIKVSSFKNTAMMEHPQVFSGQKLLLSTKLFYRFGSFAGSSLHLPEVPSHF